MEEEETLGESILNLELPSVRIIYMTYFGSHFEKLLLEKTVEL